MQLLSGLLSGLIFGVGLILAGMTNPMKVQNFLDVFGTWDPSLAFVMGGAIAVAMPGFALVKKRSQPLFADLFHLPTRNDIDSRLVVGASVFGVGWGLGGLCPGPALTALPLSAPSIIAFVVAMFVGMWLARQFIELLPSPVSAR